MFLEKFFRVFCEGKFMRKAYKDFKLCIFLFKCIFYKNLA